METDASRSETEITLDGVVLPARAIPLVDDGATHAVSVQSAPSP